VKTVTYFISQRMAACLVIICALFFMSGAVYSQPALPYGSTHQMGIRIGGWANLGDDPPSTGLSGNFKSTIHSGSAYGEAFLAWKLFNGGFAEVDLGAVNRGRVTLVENGQQYIGNLLVTPLLLQCRYYPVMGQNAKIFPFLTAGGGVYFGRRSVQFSTNSYASTYGGFNDDSQSELNYVVGGGIDYRVSRSIALELQSKYMPIHFRQLALVENYTALTITFGVKYLYLPSIQKSPRGGPHHESRH
jgi:opacity protein-like surface antigen